MALTLPNLDDLRWTDLVEEGRSIILAYAPDWTNHNPSDPGITLIELFAYASEQLMFQTDRITKEHTIRFLKLIKGSDIECTSQHDLTSAKRQIVLALRDSSRAVTLEDFERLARSVEGMSHNNQQGRAICIPFSNLESEDSSQPIGQAPGHVTLILIPPKWPNVPSRKLRMRVKEALEPARLLTTRIHVVGPRYVNLRVQTTLVLRRGVPAESAKNEALARIRQFFDPLTGWIDKKGWPLGRSVYVSELYQLLGDIEGIELTRPTRDTAGTPLDEFVLASPQPSRMKRNSRGLLEAVEFQSHELVAVKVDPEDISVSLRA